MKNYYLFWTMLYSSPPDSTVGRGRDRHTHRRHSSRREYNSIKLSKLHAGVAHNGAKERVGCVSRPRRIRVSLTIHATRSN